MDENIKKVLMVIGGLVAIYIAFVYVIPFLLKLLGIVIKITFLGAFWIAIVVAVVIGIGYLINMVKNKN